MLGVSDDGRGFDAREPLATDFGLLAMKERAAMLGGELRIESSPGHRTSSRSVSHWCPSAPSGRNRCRSSGRCRTIARLGGRLSAAERRAIRVMLVDDHPLVVAAFAGAIDAPDIELVGERARPKGWTSLRLRARM